MCIGHVRRFFLYGMSQFCGCLRTELPISIKKKEGHDLSLIFENEDLFT